MPNTTPRTGVAHAPRKVPRKLRTNHGRYPAQCRSCPTPRCCLGVATTEMRRSRLAVRRRKAKLVRSRRSQRNPCSSAVRFVRVRLKYTPVRSQCVQSDLRMRTSTGRAPAPSRMPFWSLRHGRRLVLTPTRESRPRQHRNRVNWSGFLDSFSARSSVSPRLSASRGSSRSRTRVGFGMSEQVAGTALVMVVPRDARLWDTTSGQPAIRYG